MEAGSGTAFERTGSLGRIKLHRSDRSTGSIVPPSEYDLQPIDASNLVTQESSIMPMFGATIIPHHRSSVRAVVHRLEDGESISAFLGAATYSVL
eukprot:6174336-Pleurochrysis_carterae.AAC.1